MSDSPETDAPAAPSERRAPSTPRWVWAMGIAGAIVALVLLVLMLLPGAGHGPGRHAPSGGIGHAPSTMALAIEVVAHDSLAFEPDRTAVGGRPS